MFLVLGGMVASEETSSKASGDIANAEAGLAIIATFFTIMSLGVWYVFASEVEFTFEVNHMAESGENYTAFNSRHC